MNEISIEKNHLLTIIFASLMIVITKNLEINWYLKSIIIPTFIILISYYYILKDEQVKNNKAHYLLPPIILTLISDPIINIDASNKWLNIIVIPILLTFYFFFLTNKNFHIKENCLLWFLKLFPKNIFKNLTYLKFDSSKIKDNKIKNIVLGTLIGGILGFFILNLLTSADDYFNYFINSITNHLSFNPTNLKLFIISFIILFSISVNIIKNKNTKMSEIKKLNTDNTLIITILSIVNFIFVLFIIAEISKLTFNFLRLPEKYTYSSYAREGFFQLLFVTIINFSIIIFIEYKAKFNEKSKLVKQLSYLLIAFSIILIFNSYYRMFLYIGNYGLTVLRTQVILFLAMELILFTILIIKISKDLKQKDALIFFIIILTTYIINLYICNKTVISLIMNFIK